MRILITTGIYPPEIGGPAQYAKNLKEALEDVGHKVSVSTYGLENKLPSGLRHFFYFLKILPKFLKSDFCITLDTFSVGFPSVFAGRLLKKKVIVRIGGDFLWEQHLNRTKEKVLLKDFYKNLEFKFLSIKERNIFVLTHWTLKRASVIVFSTDWQREIWMEPYEIDLNKTRIIENFYGSKLESNNSEEKRFVMASRDIHLKNTEIFRKSFESVKKKIPNIILDSQPAPHSQLMEKIKNSYVVVIPSISEVSPNLALEALKYSKPFILTKHTGLFDKLKDVAVFIDPFNQKDIEEKIIMFSDLNFYEQQVQKIQNFNFVHTYEEIAEEFIKAYEEV